MALAPGDLTRRIGDGVLAFPATPFSTDGTLDRRTLATHIATLARNLPCALVPAGGAGEMFSLSPSENETVIRTTVEHCAGLPVIAGVGHGIALACEAARAAEKAGADAILLLPPYLVAGDQEGLFRHIGAVCRAVSIGVIVYSRNNGIVTPDTALRLADAHSNLIGVKDGTGNFEALVELRLRAGDRLVVINGVPTAEILAPQCFAIGIRSYSSAVFTFLPAVARRFLGALRAGEHAVVDDLLRSFYLPLIALRNRKPGYSVSIVKAGLRVVGMPAGPVRPPLVDLSPEEEATLAALVDATRRWSV